ncbi:hypothetical protein [Arsenicicoccus bolidensis]|uniref:hypothetical protein n=1 Tax=Arsenicicoccus bolidensis TaxID=229480 RepID=UPI0028ABE3A5|nr:hypothetical protein [Arsenicicoccus bolidensis]
MRNGHRPGAWQTLLTFRPAAMRRRSTALLVAPAWAGLVVAARSDGRSRDSWWR